MVESAELAWGKEAVALLGQPVEEQRHSYTLRRQLRGEQAGMVEINGV
jgi:hypothetical protein